MFDNEGLPANLDDLFESPQQYASAVFDEGQLEKDKLGLVGVPFVITAVTYHLPKVATPRGYVTVDVTVAGPKTCARNIERGWVPNVSTLEQLKYAPGESVKVNDGSTGLRRQLTQVFDAQGLIKVGDISEQSDYDRPWPEWDSFTETTKMNDPENPGEKIDVPMVSRDRNGKPLRIIAQHGLRVSQSPDYPDTNIFYLS
jgi:hypothetical protein